MMLKVGITGNMGSGKSLVCSIFNTLGIAVFNADQQTKQLYLESGIRKQIQKQFGKSIYQSTGALNKEKLAQLIFTDPVAMQFIKKLMYPILHQRFETWVQSLDFVHSRYVLYEAALIYENQLQSLFQFTILVAAPEAIRIARIVKRDQLTEKQIMQRIENQWPEADKHPLADFIITNDGSCMLIPQVLDIHKKLMAKSPTP